MYKLIKNPITMTEDAVYRISDNAFIPMNLENTDYQAFLKYQAEGGVVLPAENT